MSDASSVLSALSMLVLAALLVVLVAREVVRAVYARTTTEDYDNDDEQAESVPSDGFAKPSVPSASASVRIRPANRRDIILALKADGWTLEQARRVLKGSNDSIGQEWRETVAASETRSVTARRLDGTTHTIELGGAS